MSKPALKCDNNASFKKIFFQKLLIAFKMAYSCYFSLGGNLDFQEFPPKKFYNINYRRRRRSSSKDSSCLPEARGSLAANERTRERKKLKWHSVEKNFEREKISGRVSLPLSLSLSLSISHFRRYERAWRAELNMEMVKRVSGWVGVYGCVWFLSRPTLTQKEKKSEEH